jgi:hypothetical protein
LKRLNASVLNALIMYRENCDIHVERLSFRVLLVEGLFSKYGATGEIKMGQPGRHASDNTISRLTERNFLRCVQHVSERRRMYCCRECNVGLCLEDCFELTKLNLITKVMNNPTLLLEI